MFVITGATGNIGSKIAKGLLDKGKKVKAIVRNPAKAKDLQGAELAVGDVTDVKFLTEAFKGATAVFAMVPPNPVATDAVAYISETGYALVDAIKASGVKNVIALSSAGADLTEKNGVVKGLYYFEQKLKELKDVNVLILRPSYFMENLFNSIPVIKHMGINGTSIKKDVAIPVVATKDIADRAIANFLSLSFKGIQIEYLLGPKDVTYAEITAVLGKAINKPELPYVEFKYEDSVKAMVGAGLSESYAKGLVELQKSINEGILYPAGLRTKENTTPTSVDDFAPLFAKGFNQN